MIPIFSEILSVEPRIDFDNNNPSSVQDAKSAYIRVAPRHGKLCSNLYFFGMWKNENLMAVRPTSWMMGQLSHNVIYNLSPDQFRVFKIIYFTNGTHRAKISLHEQIDRF
jgi:hypothetical protein